MQTQNAFEDVPPPRELYRIYLLELVKSIRQNEIHPYLCDRDTNPESAAQELNKALALIALALIALAVIAISMWDEHPSFYNAYIT